MHPPHSVITKQGLSRNVKVTSEYVLTKHNIRLKEKSQMRKKHSIKFNTRL